MKQQWLYYALFGLLVAMATHWFYFLFSVCLACLWSAHTKKVKTLQLLLFLTMSFVYFQWPTNHLVTSHEGEVQEVRDAYSIVDFQGQRAIVYTKQPLNNYTKIEVKGDFEDIASISNFYQFDFSIWCKRRGITQSITPTAIQVLGETTDIRNWFYQRAQHIKQEEVKQGCLKFIYGLNQEEDDFFLIFSSGVHLSLILRLLQSCFEKKQQAKVRGFSLVFLLAYQYFIRSTFAMQRLVIVLLIQLFFGEETRKDRLGITILACLFAFPYCIYELAFLIPTFFSLLSIFSTRYVSRLLKQLCVLLPLQLYLNAKCNLLSLFTYSVLRYYYALGFLIAHLVVAFPSFAFLMNFYLFFIPGIRWLSNQTLFWLGRPSLLWMVAFYLIVFCFISSKKKTVRNSLIALLVLLVFQPYLDPRTHVYFINVAQGDSCLILLPFHQGSMLIDVAGSLYRNVPEQFIQPYLNAHGIRTLDLVVLTHQDYDHAGGLDELAELVSIKRVIEDKRTSVDLGGLHFETVLSDIQFADENDNSLVLAAKIGSLNYLFTGDASLQFEESFLKQYQSLPIDILKVGHHGSKTSSSKPFIQALSPRIAIISVAKKNHYGHPSASVLETLNEDQAKVFQTSLNGAIHIQSIFNFNFITTSRKEFGIIGTGDKK